LYPLDRLGDRGSEEGRDWASLLGPLGYVTTKGTTEIFRKLCAPGQSTWLEWTTITVPFH
jgi:hypothetical protein